MNKSLSITFIGWIMVSLLTMASLQSCYQDDCGGFGRSEITAIELEVYAVGEKMSGQTQDQYKIVPYQGEEVSYDSILIDLEMIIETFSENTFGFSSTFACSPAIPFMDVSELIITSEIDYNINYPAGENLIEIFHIRNNLSVSSGENLKSFFEKNQGMFYGWEKYYLSPAEAPSELSNHTFQIQFFTKDSKSFTATTESILIR